MRAREATMLDRRNESPRARGIAKTWMLVSLATALAGLGGCATKPFSYLDSERWSRVEMNTYDTFIVSIDGRSPGHRSRIVVDPGPHHIVFQTLPAAGFTYSPQKALDMDIDPCVRYWFEARRANRLQQDYEPRVNHTEPIAGCAAPSKATG
jgi:hypothetical protein